MKYAYMRLKELILNEKQSNIYCRSFFYEPSNVEEEKLGNLLILGRITNIDKNSLYFLNLLASRIKREYYNSLGYSITAAFEKALKAGNRVLKRNEERVNWAGNLDLTVAVISQRKIFFTSVGKMRAFILRSQEVVDLIGNNISEKEVLFPLSVVLKGNIRKEDTLIFSTSNVFSKQKLIDKGKSLASSLNNSEKLKRWIAKTIESNKKGIALIAEMNKEGGSIERIDKKSGKKKASIIPEKSPALPSFSSPFSNYFSLQKIKNSSQKTKEYFNKFFQQLSRGGVKVLDTIKQASHKTSSALSSSYSSIKKRLPYRSPKSSTSSEEEPKTPFSSTFELKEDYYPEKEKSESEKASHPETEEYSSSEEPPAQSIFEKREESTQPEEPSKKSQVKEKIKEKTKSAIKGSGDQAKKTVSKLNFSIKAEKIFSFFTSRIFIISIIIIAAISLSAFSIINSQEKEQKETVKEKITKAQKKLNAGKNALVYKDKDKAFSKFEKGLTTIDSIDSSNTTLKQETTLKELRGAINSQINELAGRESISDPTMIVEIKKGVEKFIPKEIEVTEDNIYSIPANASLIYKWDRENEEKIYFQKDTSLKGSTLVNNKLVAVSSAKKAFIGEEGESGIEYPYDNVSITDVGNFRNYFYILDGKEGEIIKYRLSGNNISSSTLWLGEKETAKKATSIAIDGSIYLSYSSGKIKEFSRGNLNQTIKLSKTFPEVSEINQIFTSRDNDFLYLTESSENRIIVAKKDGTIVEEYESQAFDDLKDIWVDANDKNIFILSGRKIYKIER